MQIDKAAKVCPICAYEFPAQPKALSWIAVVLIVALLLWLVI